MLSTNAIAELRAEFEHLRGMREQIDRKMKCIAEVLEPIDDSRQSPRTSLAGSRNSTRSAAPAPANGTFRSQVLNALRTIGEGTAQEVSRVLMDAGVTSPGKTSLKTLVSSELWRLAKRHPNVKTAGYGRYALVEHAPPREGG